MRDHKVVTLPSGLSYSTLDIPGGGGGGAPTDAEYLVAAPHAGLSAERVPTDTPSIGWDFSTAGQAKANVTGVGLSTILDINNTETEVASTASETPIYSFTIPGGTIGDDGLLHFLLFGDYLNNTTSTKTLVMRFYLGADLVWGAEVTGLGGQSSVRRAQSIDCWIANLGSEDSNHFSISAVMNNINSSDNAVADIGNPMGGMNQGTVKPLWFWGANHGLAVDTSASLDFSITVQHSQASSVVSYMQRYAILMKAA